LNIYGAVILDNAFYQVSKLFLRRHYLLESASYRNRKRRESWTLAASTRFVCEDMPRHPNASARFTSRDETQANFGVCPSAKS
jgi:hypothetical protein